MNIRNDLPVYLIRDRNPLALLPATDRFNLFKEYIKLFGSKEPVRELAVKFATNPRTIVRWLDGELDKGITTNDTPGEKDTTISSTLGGKGANTVGTPEAVLRSQEAHQTDLPEKF